MSIKENMNFVKEEISSEEKFLESFVKVERFYKKNKLLVLGLAGLIIFGGIGYYVNKNIQASNKLEANIAFNKILENPKDAKALATLKENNTQLFQVAQYIQAKKEGKTSDIQVKYLKELAAYQKALESKDLTQLNTVSMQNDFLLKEFAIFNKALLQAQNGKFADAKATLKLIPADSKANDLVKVLNHYLATK